MAFDNMDYDFDDEEPIMGYEEDPQPESSGGGIDFNALLAPLTSNPLLLGLGALMVGLLIGLVFAYKIMPIKYVDAAPANLHRNYQLMWMQMMVDSYTLSPDNDLARIRFDAMEEDGPTVLGDLITQTSTDPVLGPRVNAFAQNYSRAANPSGGTVTTPGTGEVVPTTDPNAENGGGTSRFLLVACAAGVVLIVGAAAFYYLRSRNQQPSGKTAAMRAQEFSRQAEQTDYSSDPPIAQWMTTYLIGDDLFDDSFSIDSMSGEFLGECGVGIADNIGVGEPKRVSAFEVWLFDKNDIQTVTNVLLSEHAVNDEMTLNRLRAKGEPYEAYLGGEIELLTKTLRMVVRVMDMDYGAGHLPENSFFQRITLELAVWEL